MGAAQVRRQRSLAAGWAPGGKVPSAAVVYLLAIISSRPGVVSSSAPLRPCGNGAGVSRMTATGSSSAAMRFCRTTPQPLQRWINICSPSARNATPMAGMIARHGLSRSPGRRRSTCREARQKGQWFRCLPPETVCPTNTRHLPQRKGWFSFRRITGRNGASTPRARDLRAVGREPAGAASTSSWFSRYASSPGERRGNAVSSDWEIVQNDPEQSGHSGGQHRTSFPAAIMGRGQRKTTLRCGERRL